MSTEAETHSQQVRRLITERLLEILEKGRKQVTKDGSVVFVQAGPSDIREARAWLKELEKDGGIGKDAGSPQAKLREAAMLRFAGADVDMTPDELSDTGS